MSSSDTVPADWLEDMRKQWEREMLMRRRLEQQRNCLLRLLNERSDVKDNADGTCANVPNMAMEILMEYEGIEAGWIKPAPSGKESAT